MSGNQESQRRSVAQTVSLTDGEKKQHTAEKAKQKRERHRIYMRTWNKNNAEKVKATQQAYRDKNREKLRAWFSANRIANKERLNAANRKRTAEHPELRRAYRAKEQEKIKAYIASWKKANPLSVKIHTNNRVAREKKAEGRLSLDLISKLLALQGGKCVACKKSLKKTGFHLDHVIPISRKGRNDDRNIQLLCPDCNSRKYNKSSIKFMQEMGFLL